MMVSSLVAMEINILDLNVALSQNALEIALNQLSKEF